MNHYINEIQDLQRQMRRARKHLQRDEAILNCIVESANENSKNMLIDAETSRNLVRANLNMWQYRLVHLTKESFRESFEANQERLKGLYDKQCAKFTK